MTGHKEAQRTQEGEGEVFFESFEPFCGQSGFVSRDCHRTLNGHKEAQQSQKCVFRRISDSDPILVGQ